MRAARLLLAAVLLALAAAPSARAADRPNIIFILADDLGVGDLGCYGQREIKTPNLDRMARQGRRFTQFYAGDTVCAPSRCALMTGFHTGHARVRGNADVPLTPQTVTVAKVLKQAGYTTGLVGKWGLGDEGTTGTPNKQGFDYFFGYLDQTHAHNYYPTFLYRNEQRVPLRNVVPNEGRRGQGVATVRVDYSPDLMTDEALSFVDRNKGGPFFLYLAYTLPHANDEAHQRGLEVPDLGIYKDRDWPDNAKAYAAMVTRLDTYVGRLFDRLKKDGLDRNTIVFFASDNGPHHEGGNNPAFFHSSGPFRGIKRDLTEGGIRVPMIVRWPGRVKAGSTSDYIGYFPDFLPTATELAGVEAPGGMDGISYLPAILGQTDRQKQHAYLYWEFYEQGSKQAVRMGDWKAIRKPMLTGATELYDLRDDPTESRDLAAAHPDEVARLTAAMDEAHVPDPLWRVPHPVDHGPLRAPSGRQPAKP